MGSELIQNKRRRYGILFSEVRWRRPELADDDGGGNVTKFGGLNVGSLNDSGQFTPVSFDADGNLLVSSQPPAYGTIGSQTTQIDSTSETTIVTAGASGIYNDIIGFQITNQSATAVTVTIKDSTAGTTRKVFDLAANGGIVVNFPYGLPQSAAANNWTATLSASGVTVDVNVDFIESAESA